MVPNRRRRMLAGLPPQHMLDKGKKTSQFFTVEHPKPYPKPLSGIHHGSSGARSNRRAKTSDGDGDVVTSSSYAGAVEYSDR